MLKKIIINSLLFILISINLFVNKSYATYVTVTDENLRTAFQNFASSEYNESNYQFTVLQDTINIEGDEGTYILNYDLTDNPQFSYEVLIENGMSYEEFTTETESLPLPMLGYIAVANIQGVAIEDAITYFATSYLDNALNGSVNSSDSFIVIDDLNMIDGVTVETNNTNVIYTSEFGDRVMEYVNSVYAEPQTITDEEELNSYVMTIEKQETTETSCKLVSTLSVNLDADFSKLNGYANGLEDSFINTDVTKENADYVLTLKVGQKCEIKTNSPINGHELYNSSCIEINENYTEITGIEEGETNGYLYIGNEKKSIYITVEENLENETLDNIILDLNSEADTIEKEGDTEEEIEVEEVVVVVNKNNNIQNTEDITISAAKLPKTGLNKIIFLTMMIFVIFIGIVHLKLKRYRDID